MTLDVAARAKTWPQTRALAPSWAFWAAMLAASALGTNLGDYLGDFSGVAASAAPAAILSAILIAADRFRPGEATFWLAIVMLRAMATNIGDFLTDDLGVGRPASTLIFGVLTLAAGAFTARGRSPRVDLRYWLAMAFGGVFGTVGGDLVSHAVGLPLAAVGLTALAVAAVALRMKFFPLAALGYWLIVLAERTAGTALGDLLAEPRGWGFGLPAAMSISAAAVAVALLVRAFRPAP